MHLSDRVPFSCYGQARLLKRDQAGKTYLTVDPLTSDSQRTFIRMIRREALSEDLDKIADICSWYRGVRHLHIAPLQNAVVTRDGDLYYSRQYFDRKTIRESGFKELSSLLKTVAFIHKAGVCHGNIKPSNLIGIDAQDSVNTFVLVDPYIPRKNPVDHLTIEDVHFTAPEILARKH